MKYKSLCVLLMGLLIHSLATGQIQSVSLQASGLTCSMCSRAIYKAIQKVPGVQTVKEDIEHSSYHIRYSDSARINLENLRKAVVDAGFSVARMDLKANIDTRDIANDSSLQMNGMIFRLVDLKRQTLNGERTLRIVDKDFITEKERKKYPQKFESRVTEKGMYLFHVIVS